MKWHERIARLLNSKHADTLSVVRAGKKGAKRRTNRRMRRAISATHSSYSE